MVILQKAKKDLAGSQRSVLKILSKKWFRLIWKRPREMNCAKEPDFRFIITLSKNKIRQQYSIDLSSIKYLS